MSVRERDINKELEEGAEPILLLSLSLSKIIAFLTSQNIYKWTHVQVRRQMTDPF